MNAFTTPLMENNPRTTGAVFILRTREWGVKRVCGWARFPVVVESKILAKSESQDAKTCA